VVAKDEKQQWNAMCKVCKTKFLVGFFVRTFLVCLAGTASVSAAHLARTKQWNGSDLALGIIVRGHFLSRIHHHRRRWQLAGLGASVPQARQRYSIVAV